MDCGIGDLVVGSNRIMISESERDEQVEVEGCSESDSILGLGLGNGIPQIPIDLFVTKKKHTCLHFTDSFGNLVYTSLAHSHHRSSRVLFDPSSSNPLISLFRSPDGSSWEGFKGDDGRRGHHQLLFRVEQTLDSFTKLDFNIFLATSDHHGRDFVSFQMRGCLFWRSCTIYKDNSIVAQTNLMYKLGFRKYFVRRSIFRVTIFPGFADYNFIAALLLIFFDGRQR